MIETDELSTNQRRAIDALLNHSRIEDVAKACELTTRTIFRYLADPTFRDALKQQQDTIEAASIARLVGGTGMALAVLELVMNDPAESGATRVRAASAWLKAKQDQRMLFELVERVKALGV